MGHTRLGSIPKTRKWKTVVAAIASTGVGVSPTHGSLADDVTSIALQTLRAAQSGLDKAVGDPGLRYTFFLLTQIVLAARKTNWQEELATFGIHLSADATLLDLVAELQCAVDKFLSTQDRVSDISEMAQQAAGEAIAALAGPRAVTLFGSGRDELQAAVRELSTKKGFSTVGKKFFGRFIARFLNFYISRITAAHTGRAGLYQVGDLSQFNQILEAHCEQSAHIVYDFCGEWYAKTEFKEGINLDNTSRFMAVALKKLQSELMKQRAEQ